jgi:GNAT superfamily N-acetyltransferase
MLRIDRMTPDEWQRVRAVRLRALGDAPSAFWNTLDDEAALAETAWRARLSRTDAVTFVANQRGVDVGLVVGARHHLRPRHAGLYSMWVAPHVRRGGIGTALVEKVIAWARTAGFETLRLDVVDVNEAAVRLYERMGFEPTGDTTVFPAPWRHITEHERALDLSGL